jgi:hypothetical protein
MNGLFTNSALIEIRVERMVREAQFDSFSDYWAAIEAGVGQMPQAYLGLPDAGKLAVRSHVRERLARFDVGDRLVMPLEMIVASGRA